jgi:SulP family sulfate permease
VLVVDMAGPLFFADAAPFRESVLTMVEESRPRAVVIDLGSATFMDMDGAEILGTLSRELGRKDVRLALARVDGDERGLLERAGTIEEVGASNVYETVRHAVAELEMRLGTQPPMAVAPQ